MEVRLPSNGMMGVYTITLRMPRLNDLRDAEELDEDATVAKNQFLLKLMDDEEKKKFLKISVYDRDYLFVLVAAHIALNNFTYHYTCRCGQRLEDTMPLDQCDVETLQPDFKIQTKKEVLGQEYTFRIPTVESEMKRFHWIYSSDDAFNSEKLKRERHEDSLVCDILGKEINDENIEWVRQLDLGVFYAALYFYKIAFHGINLNRITKCPKCGNIAKVTIPIIQGIKSFDTATLMTKWMKMQNKMDFKSFMDLSIPEYVSVVKGQPV